MTQLYKNLGLSDLEYEEIKKRLKREPNELETYLFSAMWSEHCGYKHSKKYISMFPKKNAICAQENSGGIGIGEHVIFFKAESHNHPSAVEPFQGAATGIGGIIRDILTLGARPIALLNSLKFGSLQEGRNKYLLDGVVKGISSYGNSTGIPTIGGETGFEDCFSLSPLVNVLAVGIVKKSDIKKSSAMPGGIVMLLGSYTGKDGIHGASFASKELKKDKKEDKLSVQIADPFTKKVVIEATLEILKSEGIIAAQDCGAAGLLSSTSEMAYKGNCGMELYLDKVHLREHDMKPWEIMLSESQERMVFIVKPNFVQEITNIANKYDIKISEIGKTIEQKEYRIFFNGNMEANIPPEVLNNCITYDLKDSEPNYINEYKRKTYKELPLQKQNIIDILKCHDIASKKYIYSQYDYTVGNRTLTKPESTSSSGLWIKEENKFIAFTMDSNPRQCFLNPYEGSVNTVYEAFRNITASGFKPSGITDCLNFASPEDIGVQYQFVKSVEGISKACIELNIPVVSGNVSFYNETPDNKIYPTPVIGMMGISENNIFKNSIKENDFVYLIGKDIDEKTYTGGSLYQKLFYNFTGGEIDTVNSELELKLSTFILQMINKNNISGCNDISKGGLFISLFELLHNAKKGFKGDIINIKEGQKALFGEITGRYIITSHRTLEEEMKKNLIPYRFLGKIQSETLEFNDFRFNIKELFDIYEKAFESELNS